MVAVGRYLRYGLSYRDVEELLAERGTEVDHVTVHRWVQRFTRYRRTPPGPLGTLPVTDGSSTRRT
jgi:transposase-like protein